jgi:hypothetical protein
MRWFKFNWNGKEKSNCPDKVKGKLDSGMWDLDWKSTWKCEIHQIIWNRFESLARQIIIVYNFKTSLVRKEKKNLSNAIDLKNNH